MSEVHACWNCLTLNGHTLMPERTLCADYRVIGGTDVAFTSQLQLVTCMLCRALIDGMLERGQLDVDPKTLEMSPTPGD